MAKTYTTNSAEETYELGRRIGQELADGDIVALYGDLGAGKTVLTKGIAAGLNIDKEIVSPTFTLLRTYNGKAILQHFDLYRIEDEEELQHIGFYDALDSDAVSVIEWPENAAYLPPHTKVKLAGSGDDRRTIEIERPEKQ